MKLPSAAALAALAWAALPAAGVDRASPITKVLQLLGDLQAKIASEGEEAQRVYAEAAEFCEAHSRDIGFDIKTGKSEVDDLKSTFQEEDAIIATLTSKVEELSAAIASDEADIKSAKSVRAKETADFEAEEKELTKVANALERASGILQKELRKGSASALQLQRAGNVARVLETLVQASAPASADAEHLTALLQGSQAAGAAAEGEERSLEEAGTGAQDAAANEGQSGGILETLEGLLEKAQDQLADLRKKEVADKHSYQMLKQSLDDQLGFAKKELAGAKQGIAQGSEKKATAEGDMDVTLRDLEEDTRALAELHRTCLGKARDFQASMKSRAEEIEALASAKKFITESSANAALLTYGSTQASLLQLGRGGPSADPGLRAVRLVRCVRDLARQQRSPALAQLAARLARAARKGARGRGDGFAKIRGMITDMIDKLEKEAQKDANHKARCDSELAHSKEQKEDKMVEVEKLSTKLDQMTARSGQLKMEVAGLQKALSEISKAQAEMDKLRHAEHEDYASAKKEMEEGLEGVKMALKVLRDYYAKNDDQADSGGGDGIIGLLEVVESDFSKGIIELTTTENTAQAVYDKETKENEIERVTKEKDVKFKAEEAAGLDKDVAELSSDRSTAQAELDSVEEYLKTLRGMCVAKPEAYEERRKRMEAEIAGLQEALQILEGEAVFLQEGAQRTLRHVVPRRMFT